MDMSEFELAVRRGILDEAADLLVEAMKAGLESEVEAALQVLERYGKGYMAFLIRKTLKYWKGV